MWIRFLQTIKNKIFLYVHAWVELDDGQNYMNHSMYGD